MKLSQCKDQKELLAFTRHRILYYLAGDEVMEIPSEKVRVEYSDGVFKGVLENLPPMEFYTRREEAESETPNERHTVVKLANPGVETGSTLRTDLPWRFEISESLDPFHLQRETASIKTLTGMVKKGADLTPLKKVLKEMARLRLMEDLSRHMSAMDMPYEEIRRLKDNYIAQDSQIQALE